MISVICDDVAVGWLTSFQDQFGALIIRKHAKDQITENKWYTSTSYICICFSSGEYNNAIVRLFISGQHAWWILPASQTAATRTEDLWPFNFTGHSTVQITDYREPQPQQQNTITDRIANIEFLCCIAICAESWMIFKMKDKMNDWARCQSLHRLPRYMDSYYDKYQCEFIHMWRSNFGLTHTYICTELWSWHSKWWYSYHLMIYCIQNNVKCGAISRQ